VTAPATAEEAPRRKRPPLSTVWRESRELIWRHRGALAIGLLLMLVNRLAGLVLPASSKYLVDDVALVQAATSFGLSQVLSIAAQRAIADMRKSVEAHVMRLPVVVLRLHQTGILISRIMTDAEGIRNLVGTGLAQLAGRPGHRRDRARRAVLAQLAAHAGHPPVLLRLRRRPWPGRSRSCGRCSASAARSTRR
jgi:ABC-type multidrug transport system fused ATPase/permease subunit